MYLLLNYYVSELYLEQVTHVDDELRCFRQCEYTTAKSRITEFRVSRKEIFAITATLRPTQPLTQRTSESLFLPDINRLGREKEHLSPHRN